MPVFDAPVPRGRFIPDQKRAVADALNQSLVEALDLPEGNRFIAITEHGEGGLYLHPTYMGMERTENAMIITLLLGFHHNLDNKRRVAAAINRLVVEALGVSPDDVFRTIVPAPRENSSFGRGELQLAE